MAKYVCDFEAVYAVGEKVCESTTTLQNAITSYSSNVESDLSGWTGENGAKDAFISTKNEQVKSAEADCTYINELGEFIKSASKSIQELEEELAGLSI